LTHLSACSWAESSAEQLPDSWPFRASCATDSHSFRHSERLRCRTDCSRHHCRRRSHRCLFLRTVPCFCCRFRCCSCCLLLLIIDTACPFTDSHVRVCRLGSVHACCVCQQTGGSSSDRFVNTWMHSCELFIMAKSTATCGPEVSAGVCRFLCPGVRLQQGSNVDADYCAMNATLMLG